MNFNITSILKYETFIAPGGYFQLESDSFGLDEEISSIIIDQSNVFSKILSLYPNGFVLYLEQNPDGSLYRSNHPLVYDNKKGHYTINWQQEKPN